MCVYSSKRGREGRKGNRGREEKIAKKIAEKMTEKLRKSTRMKQRGIKQGFLYYWELENVTEETEKRSGKMAIVIEDFHYLYIKQYTRI